MGDFERINIDFRSIKNRRKQNFTLKLRQSNILLVDDDQNFLDVTKEILELKGNFKVETANSVEEAFKKINSNNKYSVVISDYKMPKETGLDFLKQLCATGNTTPFILCTIKEKEEISEDKVVNLGSFRYFSKSGDPELVYDQLIQTINDAIAEEKKQKKKELADGFSKHSKDNVAILPFDVLFSICRHKNRQTCDLTEKPCSGVLCPLVKNTTNRSRT